MLIIHLSALPPSVKDPYAILKISLWDRKALAFAIINNSRLLIRVPCRGSMQVNHGAVDSVWRHKQNYITPVKPAQG